MRAVRCRGLTAVALAVLALAALVSSQITFSRDWTGGKRSALPDVALDCAQFTRLCRHFVHELKTAMSTELSGAAGKRRRAGADDGPPLYDDDK